MSNNAVSNDVKTEMAALTVGSGIEYELPNGWSWTTLKTVVKSITYGHTASATYDPIGPRFLRITDIQNRRVDWNSVPYCKCDDVEKYALKNGDIVIARTGATTGKSFLIGDLAEESVFASYLIRLETLEEWSPKFLSNFMQTPHYWTQITTVSKGSAQPGANASILSKLAIPVAPIAEQARIVSTIESVQSRSSQTRALLEEVKPLIAQLRQSVLRNAFNGSLTADWRAKQRETDTNGSKLSDGAKHDTASELLQRIRVERRERWETVQLAAFEAKGKEPTKGWRDKYREPEPVDESALPELPAGWCWTTVGTVLDVTSGNAFKSKDFIKQGVPVIKIANVSYGSFIDKQQQYLDESFLKNNSNFIVRGGDTLLALTRPITENRLKACVYPKDAPPALLNQRVAMLRSFRSDIDPYIRSLLHTAYFKELVTTLLSETLQPNLSPVDLESAPIPMAPLSEQAEIVKIVDIATASIETQSDAVVSMEHALIQLDQSILSKAFRGELVPQDPNDEPASELITRIRATREAAATKKKPSKKKASSKKKKKTKASDTQ